VSGAPWHVRTLQLDGAGNKNQDRSIQPSAIVGELPPQGLSPTPPPQGGNPPGPGGGNPAAPGTTPFPHLTAPPTTTVQRESPGEAAIVPGFLLLVFGAAALLHVAERQARRRDRRRD
jgi:hypothetical protein